MCWQDQACDWTTRPQMTGADRATTGGETFQVQQQTELGYKWLINFYTTLQHYPLFKYHYVIVGRYVVMGKKTDLRILIFTILMRW